MDGWKYKVVCECSAQCPDRFFDDRERAVSHCLNREDWPQRVITNKGERIYHTNLLDRMRVE